MHPTLMFGDGHNIGVGIEFWYMFGDVNQPLSCWNCFISNGVVVEGSSQVRAIGVNYRYSLNIKVISSTMTLWLIFITFHFSRI
jgi:hypothetical protein